ncbi:MAG: oligopeptide/dipeptide ABC transporter ATP-binding protein, partial [Candidatus Thorarchaeota archaeon]
LVSAVPVPNPEYRGRAQVLAGEVPSPINPPTGCRFHPRCRFAKEICREDVPELRDMGEGHLVACHFAGELDLEYKEEVEAAVIGT